MDDIYFYFGFPERLRPSGKLGDFILQPSSPGKTEVGRTDSIVIII